MNSDLTEPSDFWCYDETQRLHTNRNHHRHRHHSLIIRPLTTQRHIHLATLATAHRPKSLTTYSQSSPHKISIAPTLSLWRTILHRRNQPTINGFHKMVRRARTPIASILARPCQSIRHRHHRRPTRKNAATLARATVYRIRPKPLRIKQSITSNRMASKFFRRRVPPGTALALFTYHHKRPRQQHRWLRRQNRFAGRKCRPRTGRRAKNHCHQHAAAANPLPRRMGHVAIRRPNFFRIATTLTQPICKRARCATVYV